MSGPPEEKRMTDGMAARPATTKSRTSSQIFLHIHPTKEIRRGEGDEKHALSFLWMMTGPEYEGNSRVLRNYEYQVA